MPARYEIDFLHREDALQPTVTKEDNMNADDVTSEQWKRIREREYECASWDLTLFQIRTLPETHDCPLDERLA